MRSLRQAIASALDLKQVPAFAPGDIGDLASKLGLQRPVSIDHLLSVLDQLPPAFVTINIDTASTPGGVSGWGQIGLQSDGACSFVGNVSNPNPGGINYVYAVALLDIKDSSGNVLVFYMSGNLYNAFQGSSTSQQQDGYSPFVAANWDVAKNSRYHAVISDSDNVLENVLTYIAAALVLIGVAGIILLLPAGDGPPEDPGGCRWNDGGSSNPHQPVFNGCYRLR